MGRIVLVAKVATCVPLMYFHQVAQTRCMASALCSLRLHALFQFDSKMEEIQRAQEELNPKRHSDNYIVSVS